MKIVIQCAGNKQNDAGSLMSQYDKPVMFVSNPDAIPPSEKYSYAHPDEVSENGMTWRKRLLEFNQLNQGTNFLNILPAYQLYKNEAYGNLVHAFGIRNVFVLSAGWGLLRADFLTAVYDITFSAAKGAYNKRDKHDLFLDFNMLPDDGDEVVFLGGKTYLPMFCSLLREYKGKKTVMYRSKIRPHLPDGFEAVLYETKRKTNWHYECANVLADGGLII